MWDRQTAAALAQFFADQGPGVPGRPSNPASTTRTLGPRDSNLAKLAQGQSLAVLKGTASVYDYRHGSPGGRIAGPDAGRLSNRQRQMLAQLLDEISRDYGMTFDAEVGRAPRGGLGLIAYFQPRPTTNPRSQAVVRFQPGPLPGANRSFHRQPAISSNSWPKT